MVWPETDRQRMILIGVRTHGVGHEAVARHAPHRLEHAFARDASLPQLTLHHRTALRVPVGPLRRRLPLGQPARDRHEDRSGGRSSQHEPIPHHQSPRSQGHAPGRFAG